MVKYRKEIIPKGIYEMDANGKFYKFTFVLNMILGIIGFLIFWGIRTLTANALVGFIVCGVVFFAIAFYINFFIVKRTKLKMKYLFFGPIINLIFLCGPTALTMLLL